ncbi:MAG: hypothetical protein KKA81_14385, partial [Bacteroidetes bacterium]|nr:hypothetical protein [Bacteroidota bacterium]
MKKITLFFTALLLVFSITLDAQIFVDVNATGNNDGSSWEDAYNDLQTAISAATSGNEIWVAKGTYYPTATTTRTIYFEMVSGVAVYGGFAGTETSTIQRTNYGVGEANETILSGDIGTQGTDTDNSYHVVTYSDANSSTRLDGFTITKGYANSSSSDDKKGGGINNQATAGNTSSPQFISCNILDNYAEWHGGGMYNYGNQGTASPTFTNCTFSDNSTIQTDNVGRGGAVYNYAYRDNAIVNPTYLNCEFTNNTSRGQGGAMVNNSYVASGDVIAAICSPSITSCTFENNSVTTTSSSWYGGGAIMNWAGHSGSVYGVCSPTINNCTFNNNSANRDGGALFNIGNDGICSPEITGCTFTNNSAGYNGGAIINKGYYGTCSPTFSKCKVQGNTAVRRGGGIYNYSTGSFTNNMSFTNCLVTGNKQTSSDYDYEGGGGGMYCDNGGSSSILSIQIMNCTFTGNCLTVDEGGSGGGAIYFLEDNGTLTATVTNSILYNNYDHGSASSQIYHNGCTPTYNNCIVNQGFGSMTGSNIIWIDPKFTQGIDAQNDPPTTSGNFSLLVNSPCINSGTSTGAPSDDIDGNSRPLPAGTNPDMGAYEYTQMSSTAPSGSGTSGDPYLIASVDNLAWLQYALWDWDAYYQLSDNINASSTSSWNGGIGFIPIGISGYRYISGSASYIGAFTGSFDGNEKVISGLYINNPSSYYQGLFGYTNGATIQDIGIENANVTGDQYVGVLAGNLTNSTAISGCYATGTASGASIVGGLIGRITQANTVSNCYVNVDVSSTTSFTGGFAGYNYYGGIIAECYSLGNVSSTGTGYIGGFVGYNVNTGTSISDCFSKGSVNAPSSTNVGGFVGRNSDGNATISNCYSVSPVTASGTSYGFLDYNSVNPGPSACFWNTDIVTVGAGGNYLTGIVGKNTSEMKTQSTFSNAGWDFTSTWTINSSYNNGYPYLQGTNPPSTIFTWNGTTDHEWNTSSNWDIDAIPGSSNDVVIPNVVNDPIINDGAAATCYDLVLGTSASLIINPGKSLTIEGNLTIVDAKDAASFTIESSESGTGSVIITGSSSGSVTAKRYLSSGKFHYVSSPINYSGTG